MIRATILVLSVLLLASTTAVGDAAPPKKAKRKPAAQAKAPKKKAPGKSKADFRTVLARLDRDGNQELTLTEFTTGLPAAAKKKAKAVFDAMQDELDPKSIGRKTISRDEFRTHFKKYLQLRGTASGAKPKGSKPPGAGKGGKSKPKRKKTHQG
jgi:hypothetical protein